ncbi:hypothetical protein I4U23_018213 [Adineta vaga]|nr:hypothetical protein I4U23_018213 [Adineta vaga]
MSDNDEIHHYDITVPSIPEPQSTEEKLHLPISSKSSNETDDHVSDLKDTNVEKLESTNIDSLSRDILQYRRDSQSNQSENHSHEIERRPSSPPTSPLLKEQFVQVTCSSMNDVDQVREQLVNEIDDPSGLQEMISAAIQQAQQNIHSDHLDIPRPRTKSIPTIVADQRHPPHIHSSATSISDELDLSHEDSTGDRSSELAAQLDYLRRMSRYEHLMDEQQREATNLENNQIHDIDPAFHTTFSDEDAELLASNYLKSVREEQPTSDEHEDEDDNEKDEDKKKTKRPSSTDDHNKSLSKHHDSDDDDDHDHDHKGNKPLISSTIQETTSSESYQQPTSNESNQKQTYQSSQQQMDMSTDSINESMAISQDSLKRHSSDSLDSEQELKLLSSATPLLPSNDTDDFIMRQHQSEPTPSQMMKKYDDDSLNDLKSTNIQYPLISNEIDIGQLPVIHARRTASENSLFSSSSSSLHMYDGHSLSASCLADKDDLTPSNEYIDYQQQILYDDTHKNQQIYRETTRKDVDDDNNDFNQSSSPSTSGGGFFDRVKAFVSKPVEIVQEVMENRRKQRSTSSLNSNPDFNEKQLMDNENDSLTSSLQQHFHSAYELHDDEQSKLVRSPELYEMDHVNNPNQTDLLPHLHIQNRTQSETLLKTDDSKRNSLVTGSNEIFEEFLPTLSKENSLEFMQQQQRLSTPYDDVVEKESSPEHSESFNLPTTAFLDTFEPTSSCQRPLALSVPSQPQKADEPMTEEEFDVLTSDYVNQVLTDVVAQMTGDHDDSSHSNKSDNLSANNTSSDNDDDELHEDDEHEQKQNQIPTDTSSFGFNDRYSADESSNTRDQSADEDHSARSSRTTTPTKSFQHSYTDIEILNTENASNRLASPPQPPPPPPVIVRHGSQSDTGTYFSAISPSSGGEYVDAHGKSSTVDEDKIHLQPPTQSNSSQYLTADDETPNFLTSDDNEYADESGTINPGYDDSSSDEKHSNETRSQISTTTNEKLSQDKYSGEGEESSGGNLETTQRRKRSNEQRISLPIDTISNNSENVTSKSVSFKLEANDNSPRSPRLSPGSSGFVGGSYFREESVDSPIDDSNEKQLIKSIQEDILRTNLATLKTDLELIENENENEQQTYRLTSTPLPTTSTSTTKKSSSYSDYDAGDESDRDSSLMDSIKSSIQIQLDDIYQEKESLIDRIKLKFERSLDRLVEKTLAGDDDTNKSDIISPFTDQSLNRSLPTSEPVTTTTTGLIHAHSEQHLQACPDELDYGTLQRFSSDSCIIIRVPEQYTPSSTLFFDQLRNEQLEQKPSAVNKQPSAFSFYTKQQEQQQQQQQHPQPSSSPIEMLTTKTELIENISPINRYTPRSLDDSSLEFGERDTGEMSDEFVLVKNISPSTNSKEIKHDTPSHSSSSSSDKHESPDLIDILQHQCEYPPLDTGFDLRSGTTLETVYESPELRQDEIKPALSTLSLTTSDILRPFSADHNSSNTPNTDDSLLEFERIEMELLKNTSTTNIIDTAREIRSSVDSLIQQHENNNDKVESFIEKHFPSIDNDVQNVLSDILDMAGDLTNSISSQSDATTVIEKSQRHSIDDDFVEITHDDLQNQEHNLFSSDDDIRQHQMNPSSHDKRRLSAPTHDPTTRRIKTPSSSSSSSSSFSSTSRSVIYSQQNSASGYSQHRVLQAETDLVSFRQQTQTQSATDLPFLPPFVNTNPIRTKHQSTASVSSTPSLTHTELSTGHSKKKTHSHPGSLGGHQQSPRSTLSKEGISSSPLTSMSSHSSSSSHHSDDCYCADPSTSQQH